MSDKFINQVYWDSGAQAYYTGSQISSSPKQRIHFANRLMEPSASIIKWESTTSYQAEQYRLPCQSSKPTTATV